MANVQEMIMLHFVPRKSTVTAIGYFVYTNMPKI